MRRAAVDPTSTAARGSNVKCGNSKWVRINVPKKNVRTTETKEQKHAGAQKFPVWMVNEQGSSVQATDPHIFTNHLKGGYVPTEGNKKPPKKKA